ncbi:MAG: DUF5683 domain-containing protein [Bacteroidia bacterium]|nr:DUF5683 domain-containing protein [Bacteroidia bacterium]
MDTLWKYVRRMEINISTKIAVFFLLTGVARGLYGQVDTLPSDTIPAKKIQEIVETVKNELPRMETAEDKLRLRIQFPWRDDILIPLPKAFAPTGARPPFDPDIAYQRSLILPGWGQAYNKSYWKIPFFYAGYGAFVWWINYNQQQYQRHGVAYQCALGLLPDCTLDPEFASYDAAGIRTRRDKFRRDRDYGIILMLGWHGLHVIEAYVDAHLNGFDVSEDLSFKARPALVDPLQGYSSTGYVPGISFTFDF